MSIEQSLLAIHLCKEKKCTGKQMLKNVSYKR